MINICSNLRLIMAKKNIKTLKQVIEITELSKPTIMKLDSSNSNSIRSLSLDTILTVCEKLGCSFDDLITIKYENGGK